MRQKVEHCGKGHGHQRDRHGIHLQVLAPHNDTVEAESEDRDSENQEEGMEDDREVVLPLAFRARIRAPNACRVDAVYGRRQSSVPNAPAYLCGCAVVKDGRRITLASSVVQEPNTRKICPPYIGETRTAFLCVCETGRTNNHRRRE
jgi:hypothetical protein